MTGQKFTLEVRPSVPERLEGLQTLANDLFYSWDRRVRGLFYKLDRILWDECGHNPVLFLRRVSQERLDQAAYDRNFMAEYNRTLAAYHTYMEESGITESEPLLDPKTDLVVYFCAEFGLHESLPIYSGGLGILAGDYCKAASDLGVPFVGVGILYRRGYFTQSIDGNGQQVAAYYSVASEDLPIRPAINAEGGEVRVKVRLPGRDVQIKVWEVKAGHIRILLLDSDLPENDEVDRAITFQLYGGGDATRIQQEMVLGIGGVRALQALHLHPTVWHINEGHAAFQILERTRGFVEQGLLFDCALEMTAVNTVFTTHTPVPAGHDIFPDTLMLEYFSHFLGETSISPENFLHLGRTEDGHGFNMTVLALRGSRYCNGVSRIHGNVAARMESHIWPEIPPDENPMGYVTNGVHVPTFLAREWANLFEMQFDSDWRAELLNPDYWTRIDDIPDTSFWSVRLLLKRRLIDDIRERTRARAVRNGASAALLARMLRSMEKGEDALVIGFARRFATYKRANLLFRDPERLARLLSDPDRRVIIVFAGKAHPSDEPGQQLIRMVHEYSQKPEFFGRLVLLEGYDLALGRKLVSGVDVWLNNPEYPLEACGTSGMKAGINGVLNLSVLDGWWDEGFNGENGWGIAPDTTAAGEERHNAEAMEILDLLENEVIPMYFDRGPQGYPGRWIEYCKSSMKSLIPRFNAQRMMTDYAQRFYLPAAQKFQDLHGDYFAGIQRLAQWKERVRADWTKVSAQRIDQPVDAIRFGDSVALQIAVRLHSLTADDVVVECLMAGSKQADTATCFRLQRASHERAAELGLDKSQSLFELDLTPAQSGLQHYSIRIYPWHRHLAHPFEMGNMLWI